MTGKDFIRKITNSKDDFLQKFLNLLKDRHISFCAIGGLAVNAYAEPVVSLDLDIVIVIEQLDDLIAILHERYTVREYPNSINVTQPTSDLRIQIQTDPRYQTFIKSAVQKVILGYNIPVATIEDVLKGKIWAAMDETRRASKRQKDMADIMRLVETRSDLISLIPDTLRNKLFSGK